MAAVKVLHEIQISPSPSLPSQPSQRLSFLDAIWLQNSQLVERLFFYDFPHPISHFINHTLPIFTKSLSLTLRHYYLLAGSIRPCADSVDSQFEIAYTEGDSVPITVAEFTGDNFRNISGHHPRKFETLHLLVKKPTKSSSTGQFPPISIQITLFPNQGLCIGFTINHAACDGSGSLQFIRSWAAACRDESKLDEIPPPFLDRSIIVDNYNIHQKLFDAARQFKEKHKGGLKEQGSLPKSESGFVSASFTLCKDHILRLKKFVQEKMKPSFQISSFVVTCAYVWRCLGKARGYEGESLVCFATAVDWRWRMRPPIPSNYFGNCLGTFLTELKGGELVGQNGCEVAAMEIGKSICGLQGRDVGEVFGEVIDRYIERGSGSRPLSVAGSPKLRVYEVDFGWGRPVKVEITSVIESGAMSMAESRDEDGGLEIGLVLSEEEMEKFRVNFSNDLVEIFG